MHQQPPKEEAVEPKQFTELTNLTAESLLAKKSPTVTSSATGEERRKAWEFRMNR